MRFIILQLADPIWFLQGKDLQCLDHLSVRQAERAGVVQTGEEKALGMP